MKKLLKYLLPLIVAAAFWNLADTGHESSVSEEAVACMHIDQTSRQSDISETQHEFCLPRHVSFGNTQRVQNAPRRTAGFNRNNLEFAKSGKVINAGLRFFTQQKSIIIHSSLIEPAFRLLYLGKLII